MAQDIRSVQLGTDKHKALQIIAILQKEGYIVRGLRRGGLSGAFDDVIGRIWFVESNVDVKRIAELDLQFDLD